MYFEIMVQILENGVNLKIFSNFCFLRSLYNFSGKRATIWIYGSTTGQQEFFQILILWIWRATDCVQICPTQILEHIGDKGPHNSINIKQNSEKFVQIRGKSETRSKLSGITPGNRKNKKSKIIFFGVPRIRASTICLY